MQGRRALLVGALSLIPAFALAQSDDTGPIRIGVSGPFTGGSSPMGESMRNGIRIAVEEINNIGGLNGRKIELVERDDQANNEMGAKIADELTRMKVVATVGIVNTGVGLASIDAYQKAKIPLVVAVSTGSALTRKYAPPAAPENYIFRISPTLDLEATVVIAELKRRGVQKVAILADTTAYGDAGLKAFQEQARAAGIEVAAEERFKIGDQDMSGQVKAAKASGAQALMVWGIGPELAAIARNKDSLGWKVPMMGSWTFSMRNFIDGAGKAGEGAMMPQTFIQDLGSSSKNSFLLAYKRTFKKDRIPSPMSAAQGYDGMHLLYLALRQANSTDGVKVRDALENLKSRYQGVITSYNKPFSKADHDAITQNMLIMGVVSNGRVDYANTDDQKKGALLRLKAQ
ncbi:ABC transporter substrate-binding protein [Noviherbaspirillum denitrificans]|uniref:ABC transporter substrate-binding protein n=1 Tax=Noviherbaspirillum denitrificans TaxID=1968433 RepID=UPI003B3AD5B9